MTSYKIPDLLRHWPWKRELSSHYEGVKRESSLWVNSFHPFSPKGQKAFDACDLNLLASLTYCRRSRDFVRLGCDLMNFYFVYDEYTDVSEPEVADRLATIVLDVMKFPFAPSKERHLLGDMTKEFWHRAQDFAPAGSPCFQHFIDTSEAYFNAVTQEARDRKAGRIRNVDDYLTLRRDSCGAKPTLALIEFGLDLPEEVMQHPGVQALTRTAVDLIILVNDMHSYVREMSCGLADHNFISVIMKEYNIDLQSAFDWLGEYTDTVISRFFHELSNLPTWSPAVDDRLREYIHGLGHWVRGNDDWSCESKRYHGGDGLKVRQLRVVWICPRIANYVGAEEVKKTMLSQEGRELGQYAYGMLSKTSLVEDRVRVRFLAFWSAALRVLKTAGRRFFLMP